MRLKMKRKPSMGRICPSLGTALCSGLLVCLSPQTAAGTEDERPMVLQYQVSHPRNTDQISLIFRQEAVELVVNKDYWQEEAMPRRLGRFGALYNWELSSLKLRVERYHRLFTDTVPLLSLLDIPDIPSMREREPDPHAPRLSLGGEEIPIRHGFYEDLFGNPPISMGSPVALPGVRLLSNRGDSIVRTMNPPYAPPALDALDSPPFNVTDELFESSYLGKHIVSWASVRGEPLDCVRTGHGGARMECLDYRFGLFELPIPVQDTSPAPGS